MKFASFCSGIEAASVAWEPLGWKPVLLSEIEAFPREVLKHRQGAVDAREPGAAEWGVPLWGDFTALRPRHFQRLGIEIPDLLVGGTPCQAFSFAGKRESLSDDRGNLTLQFVRQADAIDNLRHHAGEDGLVIVWENVPGVLSTKDNAFGCFLAAIVGADSPLMSPLERGRWSDAGMVVGPRRSAAWRVLDAQYFGLAQRRRRVFVVASSRKGFNPAAVLFEQTGMLRNPEKGEGSGAGSAGGSEAGAGIGSGGGRDDLAPSLRAKANCSHRLDMEAFVAHTLRGEGFDASEDGTGRGTPIVPVCMATGQGSAEVVSDGSPSLTCNHEAPIVAPVAFNWQGGGTQTCLGYDPSSDTTGTLSVGQVPAIAFNLRGREGGAMPEVDLEGVASLRAASGGSSRSYVAFVENSRAELRLEGGDGQRTGALSTGGGKAGQGVPMVAGSAVRRLLPTECESLQGFRRNYTLIPWRGKPAEECPDGPRYKALGNSMARPCMEWIGRRIQLVLERVKG